MTEIYLSEFILGVKTDPLIKKIIIEILNYFNYLIINFIVNKILK